MLIVQKYGGATLETPEKVKAAAQRIADLKNKNIKVVAVVSAMGSTTNELIALAHKVSPTPHLRELDMLLTVGERISMSLVSIALNDLGHEAISFTGSQAGILTDDAHLNAMIKDVKGFRVEEALNQNKIVILAGFQGVSPQTKEITTLGRGGSDTSAVAMAAFLNADRCEILKDVPSIFTADPKIVSQANPLNELNYDQLLEMTYWGAKVLHYRSVELAKIKKVKLYVGPAHSPKNSTESIGTIIHEDIMFESSKPLAVNSHAQVIAIQFKNTDLATALVLFEKWLTQNNVGTPQILSGLTESTNTQLLLTAPTENLTALKSAIINDSLFTIDSQLYCSVSLTCTGSSLNEVLKQASLALKNKNIIPTHFVQSSMSLNYFLPIEKKNEAIQVLHSLI